MLDVLAGRPPAPVAAELEAGGLFTTGAWYYRLGRAFDAEAPRRFGGAG